VLFCLATIFSLLSPNQPLYFLAFCSLWPWAIIILSVHRDSLNILLQNVRRLGLGSARLWKEEHPAGAWNSPAHTAQRADDLSLAWRDQRTFTIPRAGLARCELLMERNSDDSMDGVITQVRDEILIQDGLWGARGQVFRTSLVHEILHRSPWNPSAVRQRSAQARRPWA